MPTQRYHFLFFPPALIQPTLQQVKTQERRFFSASHQPQPLPLQFTPVRVHTRHKTEIFCQQRYTKLSAGGNGGSPAERRQCFPEPCSSFKTMGRKEEKRREEKNSEKIGKETAGHFHRGSPDKCLHMLSWTGGWGGVTSPPPTPPPGPPPPPPPL